MALVAFAKPADLQALSPGLSDDDATLMLDLVSGAIRGSVGWDVDSQSALTYTARVPFARRGRTAIYSVTLPAMHVTAVASVVADDVTLAADDFYVSPAGVVDLAIPYLEQVVVTYTAGYQRAPVDQVPTVFRTCALDYATRLAENPGAVSEYRLGAVSEKFAEDAGAYADDDHRLDPYRANL